jgi:hypothetical protein
LGKFQKISRPFEFSSFQVSPIQKVPLQKNQFQQFLAPHNLKTQLSAIIKPLSQIPTKSARKSHKSLKKSKEKCRGL